MKVQLKNSFAKDLNKLRDAELKLSLSKLRRLAVWRMLAVGWVEARNPTNQLPNF